MSAQHITNFSKLKKEILAAEFFRSWFFGSADHISIIDPIYIAHDVILIRYLGECYCHLIDPLGSDMRHNEFCSDKKHRDKKVQVTQPICGNSKHIATTIYTTIAGTEKGTQRRTYYENQLWDRVDYGTHFCWFLVEVICAAVELKIHHGSWYCYADTTMAQHNIWRWNDPTGLREFVATTSGGICIRE